MNLRKNLFSVFFNSQKEEMDFRDYKINTPKVSLKKTADAYLDIKSMKQELSQKLKDDSKKIVFGPWISEIGFETLYWMPFIRWMIHEYSIPKERVIIISRGNTSQWYQDISGQYFDIFDHYTLQEFKQKQAARLDQTVLQKHYEETEFEKEIVAKIFENEQSFKYTIIHPGLMYKFFKPFWTNRLPIEFVLHHTKFEAEKNHNLNLDFLPKDDYISAKFYSAECFPFSIETMEKLLIWVKALLNKYPIVFLKTNLDIDDHAEPFYQKIHELNSPNAIFIEDHISLADNLKIQDVVVAKSKFFMGTYGGFSYLAPLYGISAHTFFSEEGIALKRHNELLYKYIEKRSLEDANYKADYHMHNIKNPCLIDFFI